jgi:predicted deacylase
MIPIAVMCNGSGPTALLTGANHGDEYEGPIALADLALTLSSDQLRGRIIVVPFMNYPAFRAARRLSPIDGGNLNRLFPGRPDGTITEKIADFFERTLLPMADFVLDFHSGGVRSISFLSPPVTSWRTRRTRLAASRPGTRSVLPIPWQCSRSTRRECMTLQRKRSGRCSSRRSSAAAARQVRGQRRSPSAEYAIS